MVARPCCAALNGAGINQLRGRNTASGATVLAIAQTGLFRPTGLITTYWVFSPVANFPSS